MTYQRKADTPVDPNTNSQEVSGPSSTARQSVRIQDEEDMEEEPESADDDDGDDEGIEDRLAAARRRIRPSDCLFCNSQSRTMDENLSHMAKKHSFFIPDQDILIDLPGLLSYLGEKVVLGNLCIFCPNGGREFSDTQAVRKHMIDKYHCKLAYDTDEDRAEIADYYDFAGDEDDSDWEEVQEEDGIASEVGPTLVLSKLC